MKICTFKQELCQQQTSTLVEACDLPALLKGQEPCHNIPTVAKINSQVVSPHKNEMVDLMWSNQQKWKSFKDNIGNKNTKIKRKNK